MRISRFRSYPIQRQLFITFSLLILLISITISVAVAISLTNSIEKKQESDSAQTASFISMELDSEFENMETAKRQILYSTQMLNNYFNYLTVSDIGEKSEAFSEVSNMMYHVLGTSVPQVKMIGLYGDDGSKITTEIGENTVRKTQSISETDSILEDLSIGSFTTDAVETPGGLAIRTLTCFNFTQNRNKKALLEIQQQYDIFFQVVEELEKDSQIEVFVLDSYKEIIFPYNSEESDQKFKQLSIAGSAGTVYIDGKGDMVSYKISDYSKWTVLVVEPETLYMKPVRRVIWTVVSITLLFMGVTLVVTFLVAKSVTKPLKSLQSEVGGIALETLGEQTVNKSTGNYSEYEQLRGTFNEMRSKLNYSINEYMEAKREQMQTKVLALQSKMHPHFINNVLASIQILTEEGKCKEVYKMCNQLSQMLRYTMDEFDGFVTLKEEIQYANNYISLMQIRHKKRLVCHFNVPDEYMNLIMPKMVVQPLIENSLKHGMSNDVLNIEVGCKVDGDIYKISVHDNGLGFTEEKLKSIESYRSGGKNEFDKNRSSDRGVGLANIISRFSLIYDKGFIFSITSVKGDTTVTVGGAKGIGSKDA